MYRFASVQKNSKGGLKRDHSNFPKNIQDLKYINLPKS